MKEVHVLLIILPILLFCAHYGTATTVCGRPSPSEVGVCGDYIVNDSDLRQLPGKTFKDMDDAVGLISFLAYRNCSLSTKCNALLLPYLCNAIFRRCGGLYDMGYGVCQDTCLAFRECFLDDFNSKYPNPKTAPKMFCTETLCTVDEMAVDVSSKCTKPPTSARKRVINEETSLEELVDVLSGEISGDSYKLDIEKKNVDDVADDVEKRQTSTECPSYFVNGNVKYTVGGRLGYNISDIYDTETVMITFVGIYEKQDSPIGDSRALQYNSLHELPYTYTCNLNDSFGAQTVNQTVSLSNGAKVVIASHYYENATDVTFVDKNFTVHDNTLKLAMHVQDWPWIQPNGSIVIVMNVRLSSKMVNIEYDYNDPVTFFGNFTTSLNSTVYFGFLRWVQLDGAPKLSKADHSTVVPLELFIQNFQTNADAKLVTDAISFGINVPHFNKTMDYDPDFSILFGFTPKDNGGNNPDGDEGQGGQKESLNNLSKGGMAGIAVAVVGVVVVAAIIGGFMFLARRKKLMRERMRQASDANASSRT